MVARKAKSRKTKTRKARATFSFGSRTDIGCVREHNEDSLVVAPPLFVVADGMGGHAAGEIASEIAVTTISESISPDSDSYALAEAVKRANLEIIRAAQEGRGREGMGTTITAAMLEGERLVVAQVGDSRAYLLHKNSLQRITRDHSLVSDMIEAGRLTEDEARIHPQRSVITRALGSDPHTQADVYEINVEIGDRLLLCSDGLSTMLYDDEIEFVLQNIRDPQNCANRLVSEAISAGGLDNVTVIVVDVEGFAVVKDETAARRVKVGVSLTIFSLLAALALAALGFNFYVNNSAYLADVGGKVAIYSGVPGNILGIESSRLVEISNIELDSLQPGVASRILEGLRVDNLEAAKELLEDYRAEIDAKGVQGTGNETPEEAQGTQGETPENTQANTQGTGNNTQEST